MASEKQRRQIAWEAARLLHTEAESGYDRAKIKAAGRILSGPVRAGDLPSNREVREQVRSLNDARDAVANGDRHSSAELPPYRYATYRELLLPLEDVKQNPRSHPEGDALYHSLQVFDHARDQMSYDEEFLLAALLHDIGKAIDPTDHVGAALDALDGLVSDRTRWLIEHHSLANALEEGTLGARSRRRLQQSEHFADLVVLGACDRAGRQKGVVAPELDEALAYLQHLAGVAE